VIVRLSVVFNDGNAMLARLYFGTSNQCNNDLAHGQVIVGDVGKQTTSVINLTRMAKESSC